MRSTGAVWGLWLLLVILAAALVLVSGCGSSAFESNDYTMGALTSQPLGKQLMNSSGRGATDSTDSDTSGLLQAKDVIDEMRHADDWHTKALGRYDKGDYERAGELLDEAIELRPDDIRYRTDRALVALADGDLDGAFVQWEEQDRIAELNGWHKTEGYWNQQMEDVQSLIKDAGPPSIGYTVTETGQVLPKEANPKYQAAWARYGDVLDQVADFREATGEASNLVEHTRKQAVRARTRAKHWDKQSE